MSDILRTILAHKKTQVQSLKKEYGLHRARSDTPRSLQEALQNAARIGIIAEVKKASPSRGVLREEFDAVQIAREYTCGENTGAGADALSVLTDERFFGGSLYYYDEVRAACSCPVLRKEFIIDPVQVAESALHNADAILLIAEALSASQLSELQEAAREYEIETLIELHSPGELDKVMQVSPSLVGINNRDLHTFSTDIRHTLEIAAHLPKEVLCISESGIFSGRDTAPLIEAGIAGILVGEALVTHHNPEDLIRELRNGAES